MLPATLLVFNYQDPHDSYDMDLLIYESSDPLLKDLSFYFTLFFQHLAMSLLPIFEDEIVSFLLQ